MSDLGKDQSRELSNSDKLPLRLSLLARLRGETEASLSRKCEISVAVVSRYFRGKTELRARDLIQLLEALGIDIVAGVSAEIENVYEKSGRPVEQDYSDVTAVLQNLDQSVRETVLGQIKNSQLKEAD